MNELVQQLMASVGVGQQQAEGGLGLILGVLKDKLGGGDFAQLSEVVPDADQLIGKAPAVGDSGGLMGMAASMLGGGGLGDMAKLAQGFSSLGLDAGALGQFLPVITGFLENKGGADLAGKVAGQLQGE
jgi:hypothetical protein